MSKRLGVVLCTVLILVAIKQTVSHFNDQEEPKREPLCAKLFKIKHKLQNILADVMHISSSSKTLNASNVQTKWITQKLDHFDKNNNATWQMRYNIDDTVYKPGRPIFLYISGEWAMYPEGPYQRQISDFAAKYNGLLVNTEHRYYGESKPTTDLRVEYLEKYLNVEQAMADIANVIRTLKQTVKGAETSKVILAGASYAATIAAWFAKLYPELVDGVWASSAPLLVKTNFYEYNVYAGQSILAEGGQQCYIRIKNATEQAENMIKNGQGAELKTRLNLCSNFSMSNNMDRWNLFFLASGVIPSLIQYAGPNTISEICGYFTNDNEDIDNFVNYFLLNYQDDNTTCIDASYTSSLEGQSSIEWDGNESGNRQWTFQTCNEFGWFQTSTSTDQPFGSEYPLEYFVNMCTDLFGKKYTAEYVTKRGEEYNKKFGGLNPNVKNVHFTQGSLDPWRSLGINTYVIEGTSHTLDLLKPSTSDSPQMAAAHKKIAQLVKRWVQKKPKIMTLVEDLLPKFSKLNFI